MAFTLSNQQYVSGTVRMETLAKSRCRWSARTIVHNLVSLPQLATYERGDQYDSSAAAQVLSDFAGLEQDDAGEASAPAAGQASSSSSCPVSFRPLGTKGRVEVGGGGEKKKKKKKKVDKRSVFQ